MRTGATLGLTLMLLALQGGCHNPWKEGFTPEPGQTVGPALPAVRSAVTLREMQFASDEEFRSAADTAMNEGAALIGQSHFVQEQEASAASLQEFASSIGCNLVIYRVLYAGQSVEPFARLHTTESQSGYTYDDTGIHFVDWHAHFAYFFRAHATPD